MTVQQAKQSKCKAEQSVTYSASPHPKVQGLVLYKPEEKLQAGFLCSAEHSV